MKKVFILILVLVIGIAGYFVGYPYYRAFNVKEKTSNISEVSLTYIQIPKGTNFNELGEVLVDNKVIDNADDFNFLVDFKKKNRMIEKDIIRVAKDK